MLEPTPTAGRLIAFRLDQLPPRVRMRALASYRGTKDFELLVAAMFPSDRIYRVSVDAWERTMNSPLFAATSRRPAVSVRTPAG